MNSTYLGFGMQLTEVHYKMKKKRGEEHEKESSSFFFPYNSASEDE